ncbi:hypothetical protein J2S09_000823 [Bacillus fengqiuensis]|nr:hypothetical protein [Bacillus fengqiuensis]
MKKLKNDFKEKKSIVKKQKPEPLERKIVQHSFDNHHSQELISVDQNRLTGSFLNNT